MRFYLEHGWGDSLYTPSNLGSHKQIPILANDLNIPRSLDPYKDNLFYLADGRSDFPVQEKLIRRSARAGATVFDGEILYVEKVEVDEDAIKRVELRRCNFFAYASLSLQLQKGLRGRWRHSARHEQHFTTFKAAIAQPLQPLTLGCTCVTLFEHNSEVLVALAHRSSEVLNDSDVKGVLPSFGAEANIVGHQRSRYSLLFYNYFKEFAEEFFDLEELIQMARARRAHPDWILQLPAVEAITREARSGRLTVEYLGVGINPADGGFKCALLAWFRSDSFYRQLERDLRANWESSADERNTPSVQFIPLFDPLIDEWADHDELGPMSIFAIDLARARIKEIHSRALSEELADYPVCKRE
jgi:hypothetical protein